MTPSPHFKNLRKKLDPPCNTKLHTTKRGRVAKNNYCRGNQKANFVFLVEKLLTTTSKVTEALSITQKASDDCSEDNPTIKEFLKIYLINNTHSKYQIYIQ